LLAKPSTYDSFIHNIAPVSTGAPETRMTPATLAKAFIVALGLLVGCLAGAHAQTLKIGVIAPLTGGGAPWGLAAAHAAKIVAAETNARGGLEVGGARYRVEVVAYDDQFKAADSVAAYNRLVNHDGVKFVIVYTRVESDDVVALTAAYSDKALDANTKRLFRIYSTPADYLPPFIAWLKDNYKERRVAIVNANDETGWNQDKLTDGAFRKGGYEVLVRELYERAQKDFQPLFTKIIALKPEIIDLGSTAPATAGLMVRQLRELGYMGLIVKTGGGAATEVVAAAGKAAAEGMVGILYIDPANDSYKRISAAFKEAVGQEPNEILLPTYDSITVLLRAIQRAGSVQDAGKVAASFAKALPMKSALGDTLTLGGKESFGADQQLMTTYYITVVKDGRAVAVGKAK
jgi:branched-chain amino acid transport system substrate-binding protein